MKRWGAVLVAVFVCGWLMSHRQSPRSKPTVVPAVVAHRWGEGTFDMRARSKAENAPPSRTVFPEVPRAEDLREELERSRAEGAPSDPEVTPPLLIHFSEKLGDLVTHAKEDPRSARALLDQLGRCAASDKAARVARLLCLQMAGPLTEGNSQLAARWLKVLPRIPSDLRGEFQRLETLER